MKKLIVTLIVMLAFVATIYFSVYPLKEAEAKLIPTTRIYRLVVENPIGAESYSWFEDNGNRCYVVSVFMKVESISCVRQ